MSARAIDPLRLEVATVVREHKAVEGQPAAVVDDLIERVCDVAYAAVLDAADDYL